MANPASTSPIHDPAGWGLAGAAVFVLNWSLGLVSRALRAVRQSPNKDEKDDMERSVRELTFSRFSSEVFETLGKMQRHQSQHDQATERIEASLQELKGRLSTHISVQFQAQEERLQKVESSMESLVEQNRRQTSELKSRIARLENGPEYRPSPGLPRRD